MSLTDTDNYFGMTHEVLDTRSFSYTDSRGEEHEIIMCLSLNYKENGDLLNIDTKYWMHYKYNPENGFTSDHKGKTSDEMDSTTFELFESYVDEYQNGGNK
jgi:hypothetical protein